MNDHIVRAGTTSTGKYELELSPERAGWKYSGLSILKLSAGEQFSLDTGVHEYLVMPLEGGCDVAVAGVDFHVHGRETIWGEATDYVYLPSGVQASIKANGDVRIALPYCVAAEELEPRYCPVEEVQVGVRGSGVMSRQVSNYSIGNELRTSRLLVTEVITPGGNWSSYPPHKHDENTDEERELEEIYYFEILPGEHGPGMAFHATYGTPERPIEVAMRVENGDVALVPHGYHGPCVAAPGHHLYYLNVMAGPGDATWLSTDDPCYGWLRQTWEESDPDPRLPLKPTAVR